MGPGRWVKVEGTKALAQEPGVAAARGGRVLLLGKGDDWCWAPGGKPTFTPALVYDPRARKLVKTKPPPIYGEGSALATLNDGRVLLVGGFTDEDEPAPVATSWIWDPATGRWSEQARRSNVRGYPDLATLPDGRVLAIDQVAAEVFDPAANRWTFTAPIPLGDVDYIGEVVVTGGQALIRSDSYEALYDPDRDAWTVLPENDGHLSWLVGSLPDGSALAVAMTNDDALLDVMRFDRASGWSRVGSLPYSRVGAAVSVLEDGRVLFAGGLDRNEGLRTAELFDPDTGTSIDVAPMPVGRAEGTAVTLDDGSVLVAGGYQAIKDGNDEGCAFMPLRYRAVRWVP